MITLVPGDQPSTDLARPSRDPRLRHGRRLQEGQAAVSGFAATNGLRPVLTARVRSWG
jgi:hypothetical protein